MTKKETTTDLARKTYAAQTGAAANSPSNDHTKYSTTRWVPTENIEYHRLRKCIGGSFAGTKDVKGEPMMAWATSHILGDDQASEWYTLDDHRENCSFGVGFPIFQSLHDKHHTLVVAREPIMKNNNNNNKEETSQDTTGTTPNGTTTTSSSGYAGAIIALEFDPIKKKQQDQSWWSKLYKGFMFFRAFLKMASSDHKIPTIYSDSTHKDEMKLYHTKLEDHMFNVLEKFHKEHGPQQLHWYIQMVGVNPDYHGQGYGRLLMEEVNRLADEQNMIQYLECGMSNRGFYEKMGYSVYATKALEGPIDQENGGKATPVCDVDIMIRYPNKNQQK